MKAAMVGCGLFGESHAEALKALPDVQLTAVFDVDQAKAEVAERYQVPVVAGSLEELIASAADAVHVVTPESRHREPVVAALSAGRHVLVEKPFATTVEDCEAMMSAARESAGTLMVGHILRFDLRLRDSPRAGSRRSLRQSGPCRCTTQPGSQWPLRCIIGSIPASAIPCTISMLC